MWLHPASSGPWPHRPSPALPHPPILYWCFPCRSSDSQPCTPPCSRTMTPFPAGRMLFTHGAPTWQFRWQDGDFETQKNQTEAVRLGDCLVSSFLVPVISCPEHWPDLAMFRTRAVWLALNGFVEECKSLCISHIDYGFRIGMQIFCSSVPKLFVRCRHLSMLRKQVAGAIVGSQGRIAIA